MSDLGHGCNLSSSVGETRVRFGGRGKEGDDEEGSKAGNNEGAGRFVPATVLQGKELILSFVELMGPNVGLSRRD